MVKLLEPFEIITRRLSGAKYPTLNMVHPYMYMLKRAFAPRIQENETIDSYLELIYGPLISEGAEDVDVEDDSSSVSEEDDDIPTAGNRQQWQSVKQEFRNEMRNKGRGRSHNYRHNYSRGHSHSYGRSRSRGHSRGFNRALRSSTNDDIENSHQIEYLPPADTKDLLKKIRAAIYFSLDNLWNIPNELSLIATILDPRMKRFPFVEDSHRNKQKELAESLLKDLYIQLKQDLALPEEINKESSPILIEEDEDIFAKMWASDQSSIQTNDDDEIVRYLQCPNEPKDTDPLVWWRDHTTNYPNLSKLARKYLSIPATSVPSERLFSDAGNHISSKRTRLSPDLVDRILFLKRNSDYFHIFPPLENED